MPAVTGTPLVTLANERKFEIRITRRFFVPYAKKSTGYVLSGQGDWFDLRVK